ALGRVHKSVAQKSRHWKSQSQTLAQGSLFDDCARTDSGTVRDQMQTRETNTTAMARIVMTNSGIRGKERMARSKHRPVAISSSGKTALCVSRMAALPRHGPFGG